MKFAYKDECGNLRGGGGVDDIYNYNLNIIDPEKTGDVFDLNNTYIEEAYSIVGGGITLMGAFMYNIFTEITLGLGFAIAQQIIIPYIKKRFTKSQ